MNVQFVLNFNCLLDKSCFITSFYNSNLLLYYSEKFFCGVTQPGNADKSLLIEIISEIIATESQVIGVELPDN